jgi:hypothetical protein
MPALAQPQFPMRIARIATQRKPACRSRSGMRSTPEHALICKYLFLNNNYLARKMPIAAIIAAFI